MITIAVDAMGGDHAPRPEVEGAIVAAREFGVRILLVGLAPELKRELAKHSHRGLPIEIVPAGPGGSVSDRARRDVRAAGCGSECGFEAGAFGAVCCDGRNLLPGDFWNAPAEGGAALDWRRRN